MTEDLNISAFFSRVMKHWWLLIGLMILGGVAGLLLTLVRQPLYQSEATVTSVLDYAVLGHLSDWEQDQLYRSIGDVIDSSKVKEQVIAQANANGIALTADDVAQNFAADRQDTRWMMRVRAESPEQAQQLNEYWASAAMDALVEMSVTNQAAFAYQRYLASLTDCFEQSVIIDPVSQECNISDVNAIREAMTTASASTGNLDYRRSLILSHASFELTTEPTLPTSAALFSRNIMTLAGALIGLLAALIIFLTGVPGTKRG
jgi:capsular polysaccharide biosynthesis protein